MRRPARERDLGDAQGAGLVLVELERGDELACERLQLPTGRLSSGRELDVGEAVGGLRDAGERERPLDRFDLARREVERSGNGDVERPAAPLEDASELADAAVGDGEGGTIMADGDGDECTSFALGPADVRRRDRTEERERLQVDADDLESRLSTGVDVPIHELPVGNDEEHAAERLPI